jgi:YegS/Rv2252/BmrU family lipid kinase
VVSSSWTTSIHGEALLIARPRAALVFNPAAGAAGGVTADALAELLADRWEVTVHETARERSGAECARAALAAGSELVIAAGGDGTVSEVASVLVGTGVPLGIVPRGTANSAAAALGIPRDAADACALLRDGVPRDLDAASCGGRTMILYATVGAQADVIGGTARDSKNRWGALAYVASGLRKLSDLESFDVELETETHVIRCRAVAVTVANLAPAQTLVAQGPSTVVGDDALLDVTILAPSSLLDAVAAGVHLLCTALAGEPAERDDIGFFACRRVRVTATPPQSLLVDGEPAGETPTVVEIHPASLRVIAPPPGAEVDARETSLGGLRGLELEPR